MAKVLCLCQNGNSRSVALAYLLKKRGDEALAVGYRTTQRPTRELLYGWADKIVLLYSADLELVQAELVGDNWSKLHLYNVGDDVWFHGFKDDLMAKLENFLQADPL